MELTPRGRDVLGSTALLVIGFALGTQSEINFTQETALALLGGAATLLFLAARRGRNGRDEHERDEREREEER